MTIKVCSSILMFTGPHHMFSVLSGSSTIRLSWGLRPVRTPENMASAPVDVMTVPSSYRSASSYSTGTLAFRSTWLISTTVSWLSISKSSSK